MKTLLGAYRDAGGRDACLLFHNGTDGRELLARAVAGEPALPARVIPFESWHMASIGIDMLLGAVRSARARSWCLRPGRRRRNIAVAAGAD